MEVFIDNRSGVELPLDRIKELALYVLGAEALPEATELSVSFVGIDEITELNAVYRNKPEPTDILSFELDDPWEEYPCKENADKETQQLLLGDIVINPDMANKHARLEEVSLEEELWILVIHGILHLVGFDHENAEDAKAMEEKEDDYFYQWELMLGDL